MPRTFVSKEWITQHRIPKVQVLLALLLGAVVIGIGIAAWLSMRPEIYQGQGLRVEIADTAFKRAQGLSGRTEIPEEYGMLFIFDTADKHGFWMKDMLVPIDIFWLKDNGAIAGMLENISPDTYPHTVFYPDEPVRYVLETRAGHAQALGLRVGDMVPGLQLSDYVSK